MEFKLLNDRGWGIGSSCKNGSIQFKSTSDLKLFLDLNLNNKIIKYNNKNYHIKFNKIKHTQILCDIEELESLREYNLFELLK